MPHREDGAVNDRNVGPVISAPSPVAHPSKGYVFLTLVPFTRAASCSTLKLTSYRMIP